MTVNVAALEVPLEMITVRNAVASEWRSPVISLCKHECLSPDDRHREVNILKEYFNILEDAFIHFLAKSYT